MRQPGCSFGLGHSLVIMVWSFVISWSGMVWELVIPDSGIAFRAATGLMSGHAKRRPCRHAAAQTGAGFLTATALFLAARPLSFSKS
jgi:hypothetical protein